MESLRDRVSRVKERIENAAIRKGRDPSKVILVAVTKGVPAETIIEAIDAGITDIGENRVQEAVLKHAQIKAQVRWHMVGYLQTNKAGRAAQIFDVIQSVDRVSVAEVISRKCQQLGRSVDVLIQVNVAREPSKHGVDPDAAADLVRAVSRLPGLKVQGLMTIAPEVADPNEVRPVFVKLRELGDLIQQAFIPGVSINYLSMGMSNDFEVAVEEGANMVRIGRAIFGERVL